MLIKVTVQTKSKADSIQKLAEDSYAVTVREKPERGAANQKVKQLLMEYFHVFSHQVRLIKGGQSPHKIFDITLSAGK